MTGKGAKRKGTNYERELVKEAEKVGLTAERAYASNGRALGESEAVDVLVGEYRIQCKRRAKIADYLKIPEGADGVVVREDRGESLVIIPLRVWLALIGGKKEE